MSISRQYNAIEEKLEKLLADNGLVGTFNTNTYPISLTVGMNMSPAAQMELFDVDEIRASASDAKLKFVFEDGDILVRTHSRMVIADDTMLKIKGFAKKLHYLYLQDFFRYRMRTDALVNATAADIPHDDYDMLTDEDEDQEEE